MIEVNNGTISAKGICSKSTISKQQLYYTDCTCYNKGGYLDEYMLDSLRVKGFLVHGYLMFDWTYFWMTNAVSALNIQQDMLPLK